MSEADDDLLLDLLSKAKHAQTAKPIEKVSLVLDVFDPLVAALNHVALYRTEFVDVRRDMTVAMRKFREAAWKWERQHGKLAPTGEMQRAFARLNTLAHRTEKLLSVDLL